MAFDDVRFPDDVGYGSRGGPGFNTFISELDSGAEQRVSRWSMPRHRYNAAYGIRSMAQLSDVKKFYIARRGPAIGFRFKDWFDYASTSDGRLLSDSGWGAANVLNTDVNIGTGDGATTNFQLIKKYTSGAVTRNRNITKPVAGSVVIAKDGVNQASGWTVNTLTGVVTFTVAPALGVVVSAGYEYDVPVRFGKELDEVFDINIESFGDGSVDIPLVEDLDGGGMEDEYFYGGANEQTFSANLTISVNKGRIQVFSATTTGLATLLPDPTALPPGGIYFTIINGGANSFALKDNLGVTIVTLAATQSAIVILAIDSLGNKIWYCV